MTVRWPSIIPPSLPIRPVSRPIPPPKPNNLHNCEWNPDPNYIIRLQTRPPVEYLWSIDLHTPDILLLTETPMLPYQGALTQTLRIREYKAYYHLVNSPSPKDTLSEARLPPHTTHNG
jgi:hypothetical protein